jgi:hypothetical protein
MMTIWKFPLKIADQQFLRVPSGSKAISAQSQGREKWMLEHSLRSTHRDANPLAAQPDPDEPLTMRAPRKLGTTPAQVQARLQAALERRPQDYQPEAIERLLADVRGGR